MKRFLLTFALLSASIVQAQNLVHEAYFITKDPYGSALSQLGRDQENPYHGSDIFRVMGDYRRLAKKKKLSGDPLSQVKQIHQLCAGSTDKSCRDINKLEAKQAAKVANKQPAEVKVKVEESVATVTPPAPAPEPVVESKPETPVLEPVVASQPAPVENGEQQAPVPGRKPASKTKGVVLPPGAVGGGAGGRWDIGPVMAK